MAEPGTTNQSAARVAPSNVPFSSRTKLPGGEAPDHTLHANEVGRLALGVHEQVLGRAVALDVALKRLRQVRASEPGIPAELLVQLLVQSRTSNVAVAYMPVAPRHEPAHSPPGAKLTNVR